MKSTTNEAAEQVDRESVEIAATLREKITRLNAIREEQSKHGEKAEKIWTKIDSLLRSHHVQFRHGESPEVILKRCGPIVTGDDKDALAQLAGQWRSAADKYVPLEKEKEAITAELSEIIKREGSKRDAAILAAHGALIEKITKGILPYCQNEKEARAVSRGLNLPTQLHKRLLCWNRGINLADCAASLARELETPAVGINNNN